MTSSDITAVSPQLLGLSDLGLISEPSLSSSDAALYAIGSVLGAAQAQGGSPPPVASSGPYSTIYAFGDSLSDAGNVYAATRHYVPVSPPYSDGRFSNGPIWVQDMAQILNMSAPQPSLTGGTDFAYGGAQTGTTGVHTANPTDLPGQLAQFLIQDPHPLPNALYTVWAGSNDVLTALSQSGFTPAAVGAVNQAAYNELSVVVQLVAHGASNLMVLGAPDVGKTPQVMASGPAASAAASFLAALYDGLLASALKPLATQPGVRLDLVDTFGLLDGVVAQPTEFGFTNVTSPDWTGNLTDANSGTVRASGAAAGQSGYLFWDKLHPTAQAHALLGQYAAGTLNGAHG